MRSELFLELVPFPELGRPLVARAGTSDRQVIDDARTGRYHLPPESMPAPRRVLDLGANIGATVAHYHHLWPDAKIVAVELDRENADILALNAPDPSIHKITASVTGPGGWGYYDTSISDQQSYWVQMGADHAVHGAGWVNGNSFIRAIYSYTLRQVINMTAYGDDPVVDFVKMDVEGAEWDIFESGGQWVALVRHLLVELHPTHEAPYETDELVRRAVEKLREIGFFAVPHEAHPRSVWAWR